MIIIPEPQDLSRNPQPWITYQALVGYVKKHYIGQMSYISPIRHVYQTCLCVYILGSCLDIKIKWTHCKITRSISLARCHQWKGGMQGDVGECTERWRAGEDGVKAWWEIMTTIEIDPHLLTSRVAREGLCHISVSGRQAMTQGQLSKLAYWVQWT